MPNTNAASRSSGDDSSYRSPQEIDAVVRHPNPHLRANLVADPHTPLTAHQVALLVDDPSPSVQANLIRSGRDLTAAQVRRLGSASSELVRIALVNSRHRLPPSVIARLAVLVASTRR